MAIHSISLFSGAGMLDEGLRAGLAYLGIPHRTVCHVEREAHAASILVARMQDGSLDEAPVWSDVTTFDAGAFSGRVDFVVAGFPCQDLSVAGRRAGLDGKRSGLFFTVLDVADACGARGLFLENVAGIATATASVVDAAEGELDERAASRVLGELADRGWDAEWLTLSASDVGASHGRLRWFCLAWRRVAHADGDQLCPDRGQPLAGANWRHDAAGSRSDLANSDRLADERWGRPSPVAGPGGSPEGQGNERQRCGDAADGGECGMADASCPRLPHAEQPGEPGEPGEPEAYGWGATRQFCGAPLFAPGPADPAWAGIIGASPWLAPALSIEEQQDAAAAFEAAEPLLRGVADGLADGLDFDQRAARLKACGNGVVALQAAAAFVVLARRAGIYD